jgi:hypothetical protein
MISQSGPGVSVDSARVGHEVNENSLRCEGWRVAAASGAGVFVSSLFIYTFAVLLKLGGAGVAGRLITGWPFTHDA